MINVRGATMKKIFIGKILLIFNLNLSVSESIIDTNMNYISESSTLSLQFSTVLIGWFLIMLGVKEMKKYSGKFEILEKIVIGVILYLCTVFFVQMLINNELLPTELMTLVSTYVIIPCEFLLYLGIMDVEINTAVDMKGQKMFSKFLWTVVLSLAMQLLMSYEGYGNIILILGVVLFVVEVSILVNLFLAQRKFSHYLHTEKEEKMVLNIK